VLPVGDCGNFSQNREKCLPSMPNEYQVIPDKRIFRYSQMDDYLTSQNPAAAYFLNANPLREIFRRTIPNTYSRRMFDQS
jgi:hypothetical protein